MSNFQFIQIITFTVRQNQFVQAVNTFVIQFYCMSSKNSSVKLLKLIGSPQDNIESLLSSLNCRCGAIQQFRSILIILYNKIEKLREQREHYKHKTKVNCSYLTKSQQQVYRQKSLECSQRDTVDKIIYFGQVYKQIQGLISESSYKSANSISRLRQPLNVPLKQSITVPQQKSQQLLLPSERSLQIGIAPQCNQTMRKLKGLKEWNPNIVNKNIASSKHTIERQKQRDKSIEIRAKYSKNSKQHLKDTYNKPTNSLQQYIDNEISQRQIEKFLNQYQQNSNLGSDGKSKYTRFIK